MGFLTDVMTHDPPFSPPPDLTSQSLACDRLAVVEAAHNRSTVVATLMDTRIQLPRWPTNVSSLEHKPDGGGKSASWPSVRGPEADGSTRKHQATTWAGRRSRPVTVTGPG